MSLRNGRGYYPIPDVGTFPSVTTINDVLERWGIHPWIADTDVEYYHAQTTKPFLAGDMTIDQFREMDISKVLHDAKLEHTRKSGEAKDFGSRVHKALDEYHKTGAIPVEPDLLPAFNKNIEWEKSVELEVVESEKMVYSTVHRYAGTLDLHCQLSLPKRAERYSGIIDYKTYGGNDEKKKFVVYQTHKYQIAAYTYALEEMEGLEDERLDFGMVMGIHAITGEPSPKLFFRNELIRPFEEFSALAYFFNISRRGK